VRRREHPRGEGGVRSSPDTSESEAAAATSRTWLLTAAALGLVLNTPIALHITLGQHYLPTHLGTAAGVTLGLAVSAGGLATPALGALADTTSTRTMLTDIALLPAGAAGLTLLLRPSRHHE